MQNSKTKTNTNPSPDPNARIQIEVYENLYSPETGSEKKTKTK